jgi:ribonucleoside-diphosphate reductase beta chain
MLLDQSTLPLRDYHKAKRLLWNPQDLDLTQDKADWAAFTETERDLIRQSLTLFFGGEAAVTNDLAPLMIALRNDGAPLEEAMFIATQLFEEAKHVEFFDLILREIVGDMADPKSIAGPNYLSLFSELELALDALLTDHSPEAQVRAVASYHMIIEGVLAETGYYGIFTALRKQKLMPGLTQGLEYLQRDEARHIAFGLHLLSRHLTANPSLWPVVEAQLDKLMPLANGVYFELLANFLPVLPFGLDLQDILDFASRQYRSRVGVLERSR